MFSRNHFLGECKMHVKLFSLALLVGSVLATGCSNSNPPVASGAGSASNPYVVSSEPSGAIPVGTARETVTDKQEVTLIGHIGGSEKPFVDGMAAFTIVDPKVPHCAAAEGCPTPWDYCCEQNEVKQNIATIKVVDSKGTTVAQSAKELLGVKELSLVVVQGNAQRDEAGNLTLLATKVFLKDPAK